MTAVDQTTPPPRSDEDGPRRVTPGKVAAVAGSLAIVIFWIWVFATAGSYHPPGWLKDRSFPKAAEKVCASYTPRLEAVPAATTARTSTDRADQVDQVTAILADRREALLAIVPDGAEAKYIRAWLDDWQQHLGDRRSYADRLRERPGAEFRETTKESSQISSVLDKFADDNKMSSCDTFDDV
jgi:hypothetical protein